MKLKNGFIGQWIGNAALVAQAFLLLCLSPARAATYTATTWAEVVTACASATAPGDIVFLDAATFNATSVIFWTAPVGATLMGRGSSVFGGGDLTTVIDELNTGNGIMGITVASTGTFRMTGFTLLVNSSVTKSGGTLAMGGPGNLRVDHMRFDVHTRVTNSIPMWIGNGIVGVLDHCYLDYSGVSAIYVANGAGASGVGNETWAAATDFGSANFFFFEDNWVRANTTPSGVRLTDVFSGGRTVARFNTFQGSGGPEVHATRTGDGRGARAVEVYGNKVTVLPGAVALPQNIADVGSGTFLLWDNEAEADSVNAGFIFNLTRKSSLSYFPSPPPTNWGYAGPSPIRTGTGTVNVTGTAVTWVSGPTFDTGWPAGTMIYITGMSASIAGGQVSPAGGIASVNSTTSITLLNGGNTGSPLTGATYYTGSAWDGNTDALGYPAIDQPGRGQSDLLTGSFPDKINSTTGTIAWPNQALEPIYIWKNVGSMAGGLYTDNSGGRVVANRDYYPQASGIQTNATTPFDGTSGTGWGTLANRPTTCTTGVAYWATDQGSWNTSSSNPYGVQQNGADGVLYKATATNTWTLYYTPYTYPHPNQGDPVATTGMSGKASLSGKATLQ